MTILGCSSMEEAMALHHAERKRAGKRGEFNDHIRSFPVVPTQLLSKEEILRHSNPLNGIKMLVHMIMSRPGWFLGSPDLIRVTLKYLGTIRSNYIFKGHPMSVRNGIS